MSRCFNIQVDFKVPFTDICVTVISSHFNYNYGSYYEFDLELLGFDNAEGIVCCENDDAFWKRSLLDIAIYKGYNYTQNGDGSATKTPNGTWLQGLGVLFFNIID